MQQLSLLDYQPEPELMEQSQASFRQGDRVLAGGKEGRVYHDDGKYIWVLDGNVATPRDRHTIQPYEPPPKAINQHALDWHYAGLHYYRRLMLRFMTLPSAETPGKQTARRHIISHLHRLSEECLTKIKQLGGD